MTHVLIYRGTTNLGDAIQAAALSRLIPGPLTGVFRDDVSVAAGAAQSTFVVNGWLGDRPPDRDAAAAVTWLFAGVFLGRRAAEHLTWLARGAARRPVGCRDPFTHRLLTMHGVPSRMIGCATLTLPRYDGPRDGTVAVDLDVPDAVRLTNAIPLDIPWAEQWSAALGRLDALRTARVVYTSRLHVVLPCLAFGTPVVLPRRAVERAGLPARFSLLDELGFKFDRPFTTDVSALAERFKGFLAEGLGAAVTPASFSMPPPPGGDSHAASDALSSEQTEGSDPAASAAPPSGPSDAVRRLAEATAWYSGGHAAAGASACRAILAGDPGEAGAMRLLGLCLIADGRTTEALDWLRRAVEHAPARVDFRGDLTATLRRLGREEEAAPHAERVAQAAPTTAEGWFELALAHEALGDLGSATDAYDRALAERPDWFAAQLRLAAAQRQSGRLAGAEAAYRTALRTRPDDPVAWTGLATVLEDSGRAAEVVACRRQVVDVLPGSATAHSNLLVSLHYPDDVRADEAYAEHLRWAARHGRPPHAALRQFPNDPAPHRRLRVGYVSPDFRAYPAPRFFEPLLAHHDRQAVEVYCYSDVRPARRDNVTRRCAAYGHAWREIFGLSDDAAENLVRRDRIDILIDLAGHMSNPRLTLFARRVAPVQVTYVGYPSTTGLATMDYRFTDGLHDPPRQTDRYHTEGLVRLDPCCWCYRPDDDAPDVGPAPAVERGRVTFGALNRLAKASPRTLGLWARVLAAVPDSRLLVLVPGGAEGDANLVRLFAEHGIGGEQLTMVGRRPRPEYMRLWNEVDVALDAFPYHGMTTTCDGLWMGVPTVTLTGQAHVSRVGLSLLSAVGLSELATADDDAFVAAAVRLTGDLPGLARLRAGLRGRTRASALCDGRGLTRRVEAAYRWMWARWTAAPASPSGNSRTAR